MHDDFSALDLLSCGGFRLSAVPAETSAPTKRRPLKCQPHTATERLAAFLPKIADKLPRPVGQANLQGWAVPLSWPTKEIASRDHWWDQQD